MSIFKALFGVDPSAVKKTCVITPSLNREVLDGFGIGAISRGMLYACGNNRNLTLISTRMGAGFVGDAVLHLKNTPCRRLFFFGSCGALKLSVGAAGIVTKAITQDSFINLLLKRRPTRAFYPDKKLQASALKGSGLISLTSLSVSSLKLEEEYLDFLNDASIDVVDMEAGVFLAAAKFISRPALAFLFVSDIIKAKPHYCYHQVKVKEMAQKARALIHSLGAF